MAGLIDELAYVAIDVAAIDAWDKFASAIIGFEVVSDGANLLLRMDDRPFRYRLSKSAEDQLPVLGWQASNAKALATLAELLHYAGLDSSSLSDTELLEREATDGLRFECRNGISHEVVVGIAAGPSFTPSTEVSGFITSSGGMGHVVWSVPDVEAMDVLMLDIFGMELRENIETPAGPGHFYGCNRRHHSLAVFRAPKLRLEHLMVEMRDLDDVGCAMDRVVEHGYAMLQPLGRHRTDHMVSFYVQTPSAFGMEIGCSGLLCDEHWATVRETSRRRPWGHGSAMRKHHQASDAISSQSAEPEDA